MVALRSGGVPLWRVLRLPRPPVRFQRGRPCWGDPVIGPAHGRPSPGRAGSREAPENVLRSLPARGSSTALGVCRVILPMRADEARQSAALPMQQIADWLEKLGLGQYAQRFAENDFSVLPNSLRTSPPGNVGTNFTAQRGRRIASLKLNMVFDAVLVGTVAYTMRRKSGLVSSFDS